MKPFNNILVANRGEIAARIIRTANRLGYHTIAVYSEADKDAPYVGMADDAVLIGPAPVGQSYLDQNKILAAARQSGAEAIHPGYGFLSENAEFAEAGEKAGLVFIGPDPKAIELMGNKAAAKRRMIAAGIPCVPGYQGEDQSDAGLIEAAANIGYPIMVKAAAGGGGRGMRLVERAKDLSQALASARSEALNAFGSDELILEKAILRPRHVEIQILADTHGNILHLGERDCSVQRRHQKIIEEAPCPVMSPDLRARMAAAAISAASDIGYHGVGTIEFLVDKAGEFYFLEMNTRLQVEHPVTEMITGLDLVSLQIDVAQGRVLEITQDDIIFSGHAIEARLYAENPEDDFLPSTGTISCWRPSISEGLRFDSGVAEGQKITPHYDPMIAKIIAWGETRDIARKKLIQGLRNSVVFGVKTNRNFLIETLANETFASGAATTAFIEEEFPDIGKIKFHPSPEQISVAVVLLLISERQIAFDRSLIASEILLGWSNTGTLVSQYQFEFDDEVPEVSINSMGKNHFTVTTGENTASVEVVSIDAPDAILLVDGRRQRVQFFSAAMGSIEIAIDGVAMEFRNRLSAAAASSETAGSGIITAPMHGTLVEVDVSVGDVVKVGTKLAALDAMKMQHDILSDICGTVTEVQVDVGQQVGLGDLMITIEANE